MEKEKIQYYQRKLLDEKKRIYRLLNQMEKNETISLKSEMASELSFYDNHPADTGGNEMDRERGMALRDNERNILDKIEDALHSLEEGTYGNCKFCHTEISKERLDFIPYAQLCVSCQNKENEKIPPEKNNRAPEEEVLGMPFGFGYNDYKDDAQFDAEDSFQGVERFNILPNVEEYYNEDDEYVEPIEKISNEQYRNQLPD